MKNNMKKLVIANWKMNPSRIAEARDVVKSYAKFLPEAKGVALVVCPPTIFLAELAKKYGAVRSSGTKILFGAQDTFFEKSGDPDFSFSYEIDCQITKDGKNEDVFISPITQKVDPDKVAFHIAHEVWGKLDKTDKSQLWNNFEPKK
jgi:triosephosphate isomerase